MVARRPLVERGVISPRKQVGQLMVGLMALPLTALPRVPTAELRPTGRRHRG